MSTDVTLDGTLGGGQILRTALTLSLVTGKPFSVTNFRAQRAQPGLRPSHLKFLAAAEALCFGQSGEIHEGDQKLTFRPGEVRSGEHLLDVGASGSGPLLLQTLLPALSLAGGGQVVVRGGTHLPQSPGYHYLVFVWLPAMARFGIQVKLKMQHAGLSPSGAGEITAEVSPPAKVPERVEQMARGTLREVNVISLVGGVPFENADRQSKACLAALRESGVYAEAENLPLPVTPSEGSMIFIRALFEKSVCGFSTLGDWATSPETTGRICAQQLAKFLEGSGAIDEHLGDQLLIPAALLAAGKLGHRGTTQFRPDSLSRHLRAQAEVVPRFLPVQVTADPQRVSISPADG